MKEKQFYKRNLPHWQPIGGTFSITFRLHGSLPKEEVNQLLEASKLFKSNWTLEEWDAYFNKFDALLDRPVTGPTWLEEIPIAHIIINALHFKDGTEYRLIAFCIMKNHVHLIIDQIKNPLFRILQSLKGFTARRCNELLDRTNHPFWQKESYDHLIRNDQDLTQHLNYLVYNPVLAGQIAFWQDYPFTYIHPEFRKYII